jgi:hypothetical protein
VAVILSRDGVNQDLGMGQSETTETWGILTVTRHLGSRGGKEAVALLPALRQASHEALNGLLPTGHAQPLRRVSGAAVGFGGGLLWYLDSYTTTYCQEK